MSKGSNRRKGNGYEEGFDRIFGKEAKAQTSFKRFSAHDDGNRSGVFIIPDIEPFISPVDGKIIKTRSQLREHNREHGVTNQRDYSESFFEKKHNEHHKNMRGGSASDKAERIEIMRELLN